MVDGSYQSARRKNSTSAKGGGGVGYAINKDGKPVALRRRPEEPQEPKDDVRFRSSAPQPGRLLTQHTGLPPRAGTGGKAPGRRR
jgi:hypothetical protein